MSGTVAAINHSRAMIAVMTSSGFTTIELMGDEVSVGDELTWTGHNPLGGHSVRNVATGRTMNVYFQNHWVGLNQLLQQLLYQNGHRLEMTRSLAESLRVTLSS